MCVSVWACLYECRTEHIPELHFQNPGSPVNTSNTGKYSQFPLAVGIVFQQSTSFLVQTGSYVYLMIIQECPVTKSQGIPLTSANTPDLPAGYITIVTVVASQRGFFKSLCNIVKIATRPVSAQEFPSKPCLREDATSSAGRWLLPTRTN